MSGQELVKMGFFQDFEELDLEALLHPTEQTVSVASRREETLEQAPGVVTVVRSDEIRSRGAASLGDVLRTVPGLDITVDGLGRPRIVLRGVASGLTGGASENVLLLFNGQRLNEDVSGGFATVNLDMAVDHIRQVEVLRGPASALFGDGALSGVINVVTQTDEDFMGTEVLAGGGSFGGQDYLLRSGAHVRSLTVSGYVRYTTTSGARRLIPADAQTASDAASIAHGLSPISLAPGPTTDHGSALETSYRLGYRDFELGWRTRKDDSGGLVGFTDSLGRQNQLSTSQLALDAGYRRAFDSLGTLQAHLRFTQSEIHQLLEAHPSGYRVPAPNGSFVQYGDPGGTAGVFLQTALNSRLYGVEAVLDRDLGPGHHLTAGLGLDREATFDLAANANLDLRTLTPVAPSPGSSLGPLPGAVADSRRTVFDLFAQDVWSATPRLTLTGGLRFDHLSDAGPVLSPRLALVGRLPEGLQEKLPLGFKVLYGRSFRAPTFSELHFRLPGFTGNPDLGPTVADNLEAALSYRKQRLTVSGSVYLNLVRNAIVPLDPYDPAGLQPTLNGPGLNVLGFEAEARGAFGVGDTFFANYAYQRARDRATGRRAAGLPSHIANLSATFNIHDRWGITPTLHVRGDRPRAVGDPRPPVAAYALLDLNLRARNLYRTLEADLALENLFGQAYFDPSLPSGVPGDYPRPGRRVLVRARYRF